jgi:hypothetical protein
MKFGKHHIRSAKLSPEKVLWIREQYTAGVSQGALARETGMSVGQIGRIVRGECWQGFQRPILDEDILESEARFKMNIDADLVSKMAAKDLPTAADSPTVDPLEEFLKGKSIDIKGEDK